MQIKATALRHFGTRQAVVCLTLVVFMLLTVGFSRPKNVTVVADGKTQVVSTKSHHSHKILAQAGVKLGQHDEVTMSTRKVEPGTVLTVHRAVPVNVRVSRREPKVVMTAKRTVGDLMKHLGYHEREYVPQPNAATAIHKDMDIAVLTVEEVRKLQELEAERQRLLAAELERRKDCVETSRGWVRYKAKMIMEATAYLPTDGGGSGITATGARAAHGIAAVDPDVIPLGTRLYVPGYGFALAADTGGAINGYIIDLCMESYNEAIQFGRRDVTVYILE